MKVRSWLFLVVMVLAILLQAGGTEAALYKYQDLTSGVVVPPGVAYFIKAINDAGQIVGYYSQTNGSTTTYQGFFWDPVKGQTLLQSLGGTDSVAYGINKQGQIVGAANTGSANHPCLWTDPSKAPIDLAVGVLAGSTINCATAINDNGLIIGGNPLGGIVWTTPQQPVVLGTGTFVNGVNNAGQIVGITKNDQGIDQGCIWESDGSVKFIADATNAKFINNQGNVVGVEPNGMGGYTNFFWDHQTGTMLDLGLATHAISFDDANQAIAYDAFRGNEVYLWSPTRMIWATDLTGLVVNLPKDVTITTISLLSPQGSILGTDSQGHACLLTPMVALPGVDLLLLTD